MVETYVSPDSSGRGWPIFTAIAFGLIYLLLVGFVLKNRGQMYAWRAFPFAQFLYVGPFAYYEHQQGRFRAQQGWLIGAAIAALVYSPCWGLAWMFGQ